MDPAQPKILEPQQFLRRILKIRATVFRNVLGQLFGEVVFFENDLHQPAVKDPPGMRTGRLVLLQAVGQGPHELIFTGAGFKGDRDGRPGVVRVPGEIRFLAVLKLGEKV
jgi:hypothetical protein